MRLKPFIPQEIRLPGRKTFLLLVYIKRWLIIRLDEGGMKLKLSIILALALMLSASGALAFGSPGSVVVDIVGSRTDNTKIVASGPEKVELEIIGSTASNTTISPHEETRICPHRPFCPECPSCLTNPCPDAKCDNQQKSYPWDDMHLGVDAWYGTFWYKDINMPKWPQI
jgi:hypothetical protein